MVEDVPRPPSARLACPNCRAPLADRGRPHCGETSECRWLTCSVCRAVYDTTNGNHYSMPDAKEKP